MKKFIINTILFGTVLLIINIGFYAIIYEAYYKNYEQVDLSFESYLLADSHGTPLENLIEEYGVYNFSAASDSYFDMLIKVKYLIKHTDAKRIIIAVDDHSLSPYRENINNLERSTFYIIEEDFSSIFNGDINSLKKHMVLFNPSIRGIIRSFIQSKLIENKKTKEWSFLSDKEKVDSSTERYNFQFNFRNPSATLTSSLLKIIDLCEKNNIELIGIQFPLTLTYFNTIKNKSFNANKIFLSKDLKVYDFRNSYQYHDDYFSNQDHLNQKGSKEFVKQLVASFIKP